MYEKNGEKYFIVDSHMHFWDASRENWVEGRENYAKGWIDCFYGYHQLAPPKTQWEWDHYLKVSEEDLMRDVFEEGYVDKAIFQSTYLKYWYKNGFNTVEQNGAMLEKHPDKFIVNGRWDPRDGEAGLRQLEEDARRWNLKGVKLYTAEWHENGSRGWKLTDKDSYRFLEKCQELGIRNIHAHKGPTIWPLNKDAFAVDDVYAGCSVVIGALMHARPKFFARVMGELLFWVGEDRMTFGSDYNIWTPKWQVEGLVDWQMPDDEAFADYPKLTTATKKKILGLNAAKLYDIEVPEECRLPEAPNIPQQQPGEQLVTDAAAAGSQA
jgi:predicted TIM-barrel fold metal-dependent hydrolase